MSLFGVRNWASPSFPTRRNKRMPPHDTRFLKEHSPVCTGRMCEEAGEAGGYPAALQLQLSGLHGRSRTRERVDRRRWTGPSADLLVY